MPTANRRPSGHARGEPPPPTAPLPEPEPLPAPETTAATRPAAPVSQTDTVAEIPSEAEAEVRVITPVSAPAKPRRATRAAAVQPVSATATMEATDDDPGPPPPETAVLAAAGAPPLRPVLEVFEEPTFNGPPARLVPRLEGPLRQGDGGRVLPAQRLRRGLVLRARSEDRRDRTDAADRVRASSAITTGCDGFAEIACTK